MPVSETAIMIRSTPFSRSSIFLVHRRLSVFLPPACSSCVLRASYANPAVTKEQRDIDPTMEITVLEHDPVGFVKQTGVEYDSPVRSVRNRYGSRSGVCEKFTCRDCIIIIFGKVPIKGGSMIPNNKTTGLGIEIGIVRRDPEIDIYRSKVGMYSNAG
jgi:hypothetical protein